MGKSSASVKHTVSVETTIYNRYTGEIQRIFGWYSAPCSPAMARSIADSLRKVDKSYRITLGDHGPIIDQWCREGWEPTDKLGKVERVKLNGGTDTV